jgi:hypothetical protein
LIWYKVNGCHPPIGGLTIPGFAALELYMLTEGEFEFEIVHSYSVTFAACAALRVFVRLTEAKGQGELDCVMIPLLVTSINLSPFISINLVMLAPVVAISLVPAMVEVG